MNIKFKKENINNEQYYFFEKELKIKNIIDYEFKNIRFQTNKSFKNLFSWNKFYSHKPFSQIPVTQFAHN